jgi:hypothetical protein
MKAFKIILASVLASGFAGMANGQTVVHIAGSSAFRAAAYDAIESILNTGFTGAYTGTAGLNTANQAVFSGSTITGNIPVIIKTSWSGSVDGLAVLTKNFVVPDTAIGVQGGWLANIWLPASGVTGVLVEPNDPNAFDTPVTADVTFSDSFQSSTLYTTPVLTAANGYTDGIVAVAPFVWVAGNDAPPTLTNITNQLAQAALLGVAVLSQATGNASDRNIPIEVVGGSSGSGARLEAFAETGFGILKQPVQYDATISGGVITSIDPWPGQFTDDISYPAGTQGYTSCGGIVIPLETPGMLTAADNPGLLIGYVGIGDAYDQWISRLGIINFTPLPGITPLAYDGVPYSPTAVQQGLYTFWSYEHVYYRSNYGNTSPNGKTVADQIAAQIHNVGDTYISGILVGTMAVGRGKEGSTITPGNSF